MGVSTLRFVGKLTERDWIHARMLDVTLRCPWGLRVAIGLPSMAVAIACVVAMAGFGASLWLFPPFYVCLHVAIELLLLPALTAGRARKEYRSHADTFLETTVALSAGGVSIENARGRTELGWESILVVADSPRGLLFRGVGDDILFWLPARVLGDGARDEILLLLNSVGADVRRVG